MMMNQHELRAAVRKHCGIKMDQGEKICRPCAKKLSRARKIEKQIEQMWRKYYSGYFNRPKREYAREQDTHDQKAAVHSE